MKIRISPQALTAELFKLQGVVSQRSTLAILSNALLEAKDGRLTLHATDLDTSISTSCDCEVLEEGSVTLEAKSLYDIVKNLNEESLDLETEENYWAKLKSGSFSCRIAGTHPDDFPQILNTSTAEMYPIGTDVLLTMVEKTLFSVSNDDARPNLTGAFFRVTPENSLLMVSTDGHRLSKIETDPKEFKPGAEIHDKLKKGIIIPRKGLSELKRIIDAKSEDLSFGLVENSIVFKSGPMTMSALLIEGTFPDFTQVLPRESDNKAVLHKDQFLQALKFVSLFASPKTHNLRLQLSDEGLELYASDPERGEGKKTIPTDYTGQPVKAGYNYRYLIDVLNVLDGDQVALEIIDTLSPTLVRDTNNQEALFVVMPMRL